MRAGSVATYDRSVSRGWHHLAGVRRGGTTTLYVDGSPVGTGESDLARSDALATEAPLLVGGGSRAGFEGELSDVRVWDRALGREEIASLGT